MLSTRIARLQRIALFAILGLAAVTIPAKASQRPHTVAIRSWIDRYYADYAAMSATPVGPAMDKWLSHYAPYTYFEDPTAGLSGMGHEPIRKAYVDAFTNSLGPVRWTVLRRITHGDWAVVEGWLDGTQKGKPFHTRFTTWFKIREGKIAHQIDYVAYETWNRQVTGKEEVSRDTQETVAIPGRGGRDGDRAIRLADEFYRRYEAMPVLASPGAIGRHIELMTPDFKFEDPTFRLIYASREKMQAFLNEGLTTGDFGPFHWEIDRRITDGSWIALEGTWRGVYKGRPFASRFTTWLQVRGHKIARHIDYIDYKTFRRQTSPPKPSEPQPHDDSL